MPSSLIDLDDEGSSFLVRWGDFVTLVLVELTNGKRLALSVVSTAGACKDSDSPSVSFPGAVYYPDEAQSFSESRLPITGANVAALMATDFPWTPRATVVRDQFPISSSTVSRIRTVAERLHRERVDRLQQLLARWRLRDPEAIRELSRPEQPPVPPPDAVAWDADRPMAST
jgi:hypothetical protein